MPVSVMGQCMVTINTRTVMVIGGSNTSNSLENSPLPATFYFNMEEEIWREGPPLNFARRSHSCGVIRKTGQISIIVVGGFGVNDDTLSSVEILDGGATEWRNGPDFFVNIFSMQIVEGISPTVYLCRQSAL